MSISLVSAPAQLWDYYVAGPYPNNLSDPASVGSAQTQLLFPYLPEQQNTSDPRDIWVYNQGGSGVTSAQAFYRGVICTQLKTSIVAAIDGMGGIALWPVVDVTGMGDGAALPSWRRVQWLTVNMALEAGTLGRNTGLLFSLVGAPQTSPRWPIAPAAQWQGGWGVVGDGAGGWNWESTGPGVPAPVTESVPITTIADAEDWHTFDFVSISGAGGREASFQLWVDGALFLTRDWVNAPALQGYSGSRNRFTPIRQIASLSNENLYFGDWEFRMGRFLPDGRELFR